MVNITDVPAATSATQLKLAEPAGTLMLNVSPPGIKAYKVDRSTVSNVLAYGK